MKNKKAGATDIFHQATFGLFKQGASKHKPNNSALEKESKRFFVLGIGKFGEKIIASLANRPDLTNPLISLVEVDEQTQLDTIVLEDKKVNERTYLESIALESKKPNLFVIICSSNDDESTKLSIKVLNTLNEKNIPVTVWSTCKELLQSYSHNDNLTKLQNSSDSLILVQEDNASLEVMATAIEQLIVQSSFPCLVDVYPLYLDQYFKDSHAWFIISGKSNVKKGQIEAAINDLRLKLPDWSNFDKIQDAYILINGGSDFSLGNFIDMTEQVCKKFSETSNVAPGCRLAPDVPLTITLIGTAMDADKVRKNRTIISSEKIRDSMMLKVAEALQNDAGRGLVRINSQTRKELGVSTGDIVELKGKRSTVALVWQAHPQDEGLDIIRMDGFLRQNTSVALGEMVEVKNVELVDAKKVVLAPTQPMKYSPGFDQFVKKKLEGRGLMCGDTIFIGVFGTSFPLVVYSIIPDKPCMVVNTTEIILKDAPPEIQNITKTEEIIGMKEQIIAINNVLNAPDKRSKFPQSILLFGPTGCGKTLLANNISYNSDKQVSYISAPKILGKYTGESEQVLRELFEKAKNQPSLIFIDQIDVISRKREQNFFSSLASQLFASFDDIQGRPVFVIATTNRPDLMDTAFLRPGRFDLIIPINLPTKASRMEFLEKRLADLTKRLPIGKIGVETDGFSYADLDRLCADIRSMLEKDEKMELDAKATTVFLSRYKPSVTKEDLELNARFEKEHAHY